jgi:hypothetical protein
MCPYAVSATGTATTFVTANNAVIKLGKISQGSYLTISERWPYFYDRASTICT